MTNRGSVLRGIAVGLFVSTLSVGACDGGGSGIGGAAGDGAGGGSAGEGGGGAGGSPTLVEGARCALGTTQSCDPVCGASCGTSPGCIDLCCQESTTYGVVCDGTCQDGCTYHDENDPACTAAAAMPQPDGTCTVAATVKSRTYAVVATPDARLQGLPEVKCTRALPNQSPNSIGGVAPGAPCTGDACMTCTAALAFWQTECCGL